MSAAAPPVGNLLAKNGWRHFRLGVVVPIGATVALTIIFVVVAVLGSAHRADQVALEAERQLFIRALANEGERVLRELESAASSETAITRIRDRFDHGWVQLYVGSRLQSFFGHDFVFVTAAEDRLLYASSGRAGIEPRRFDGIGPDVQDILDEIRGRSPGRHHAVGVPIAAGPHRAVRLQRFLGAPAVLAAVGVTRTDDAATGAFAGPIALSVKFIDEQVLADMASRLQLHRLHKVSASPISDTDYVFNLAEPSGEMIAQFGWTPKQPGAEIVESILPFVALALAGFALLAAVVLSFMRRSTAAITAGETRLRHLALHDPLCGLPNRVFFGDRLEAMIQKVRQGGSTAAVFYIDLDHFKEVNDTLGHPVGDELIRSVSQRLSRTLQAEDLVARLGGDEFAVIAEDTFDHAAVQAIAARMIASICAPYSIAKQTIVIGASIGIAVITKHVGGAADVMRHADLALYRAKNEGRNRACIYDSVMDADLLKRKLLENELRVAIRNDALGVAYQPIVNNSGEIVLGVEALCRWTHPTRGEVPPAEFIPIAEHSGLIIELGELVLRRACLDGKAWPGLIVSVNVSPLQFRRTDFFHTVERVLSATDFEPARLELELTESTLIGNLDTAELAMRRLKGLGVRLALDDFGTGYSSLLYLRRFPFDKLKIDSSFVRSIERAADAAAIVHAVVSLGRGLGMKVTAEGVETAEQHLFLRAAGVHCMQGYRFGRPGTAAEISARLANPNAFHPADDDPLLLAG
ncbi:MAG: putative bifunctional diguanylate cyclase/phosphodiesterase [Xanthobacteraceae bacterium]